LHLASASSILLQPDDAKAQALCDAYTVEFMAATGHTEGNVHLVTTIHDASHQGDGHQNKIHLITFDGGLTPDEMDAYVSLRMINRPRPRQHPPTACDRRRVRRLRRAVRRAVDAPGRQPDFGDP
jgi:hypothetical protein